MENIEQLRKKYYEAIILLQDEQDILDSLPQPDYGNFFEIITGLIERIDNELQSLELEYQNIESTDIDIKEYIKEEIKILTFKKNICINLLNKGKEEETLSEESEKRITKNIIFATTNSGNVFLENDIKNLPEEYYESIIQMLQDLQNGIEENNTEKAKAMRTVNKKMAGIHSVKDFKVRLYYKRLAKDTLYVIMVRMKKSDNDALDRKEVINRATKINNQYEGLKKQIKDPIKKQELIVKNEQIITELYDYLNQKKRGK